MKAKSIWSEINDDFIENDLIHIDGYTTSDENEEGKVIATINIKNGIVKYLDKRAKTNNFAQQVINDKLNELGFY